MAPKKTASKKIMPAKAKKPNKDLKHPKVSVMVNTAISTLKERGGSSTQAIKKYLASHYKVNAEKLSPFIKKYLKSSVESGTLVQISGRGASGSFKLASHTKEKSLKSKAAHTKEKSLKSKAAVPKDMKALKGAVPRMQLPVKNSVTKNINSKKGNISKTVNPTANKAKKISAVMRVDGSRAPSMYAKNINSKKGNRSTKSKTVKPTANKAKKISAVMRVDNSRAPSKAPSMYAK